MKNTLQKIIDDNYLSGVIDRKKIGQALIEVEIGTDNMVLPMIDLE